jgi:uncharacterized protein (DUF305 family)
MQIKWRLAIPLIFVCAAAVPAPQRVPREGAAATPDQGWTELTSSMEKMHHAMSSVAPSGDTDEDFVRLMLPHHQAAIDMAKTELLLGKNPQLRRLAQEIITDQQSEIQLMELWLKKNAPAREKAGKSPGSGAKED